VLLFFSLGGFGEISPKLEECFTGRNLLTLSFEARRYFMHRGGPATQPAREHVAPGTPASCGRSGDWRGAVIGQVEELVARRLVLALPSGWCLLGRIAACLVQPLQLPRHAAMGGFAKSAGAVRTGELLIGTGELTCLGSLVNHFRRFDYLRNVIWSQSLPGLFYRSIGIRELLFR